ncbi:type VI secretion system baseplate subunit TssE [Azospirillum sp. ST 5-10]|uniref:type VI secretion system baseplate subunit TssE n=1 Tax=unclassified Azospirillum TaxID=2630922 RepID=UPI003F49DCC0
MAREYGLLERLARPELAGRQSLKTDAGALTASVMENLRNLLNTRRGSSAMLPDYGMPDFNDLALQFPDAIDVIARELKATIRAYEPRLKNPKISHLPDPDNPLALCYRIAAELTEDGQTMTFETVLGDDGFVRLR